jgi:hypothetical protein
VVTERADWISTVVWKEYRNLKKYFAEKKTDRKNLVNPVEVVEAPPF